MIKCFRHKTVSQIDSHRFCTKRPNYNSLIKPESHINCKIIVSFGDQ